MSCQQFVNRSIEIGCDKGTLSRQHRRRTRLSADSLSLIDVIRNTPRGFSVCNISLSAYLACPRRFRHACRGRSTRDNALRARTPEQDKADDTARNCMLSVASTRGHVRGRVRGRTYARRYARKYAYALCVRAYLCGRVRAARFTCAVLDVPGYATQSGTFAPTLAVLFRALVRFAACISNVNNACASRPRLY